MTMLDDNPRATIGDNQPDWAKIATDRLQAEHEELAAGVAAALANARAVVPDDVTSDDELKIVTEQVVTLRDLNKRVLAIHAIEKEPFLRQGQACDHFFFGMRDRLLKAMNVIGERGNVFNVRKAQAERLAREAAARAAAEAARAAREEQDRLAREAAEREAAAARARKPENVAAHQQAAEQAAMDSSVQGMDAMLAEQQAGDLQRAAQAPTADLVRQRFDSGRMVTGKQVPHVEIIDANKLDLNKLRPYFTEKELLRVLKVWAKVTDYKQTMPGAVVEMRDGTDYR